jgi:hypothetical protein
MSSFLQTRLVHDSRPSINPIQRHTYNFAIDRITFEMYHHNYFQFIMFAMAVLICTNALRVQ